MTPDIDILVVGAGPTGLTLALQAHDHGARVRIVERRPAMPRPSRALLVYPRTLEMLRPLGSPTPCSAEQIRPPKGCCTSAGGLSFFISPTSLSTTAPSPPCRC